MSSCWGHDEFLVLLGDDNNIPEHEMQGDEEGVQFWAKPVLIWLYQQFGVFFREGGLEVFAI